MEALILPTVSCPLTRAGSLLHALAHQVLPQPREQALGTHRGQGRHWPGWAAVSRREGGSGVPPSLLPPPIWPPVAAEGPALEAMLGCWRPSAASNLSLSLVAESPHGPNRSVGAPSSATAGTESAQFWRGRCSGRTWPQKCSRRLRGRLVRAQGPGRPLLPTSWQQRATGRGGATTALSVCWEPRCPHCQPAVWVTLPATRAAVCTHPGSPGVWGPLHPDR